MIFCDIPAKWYFPSYPIPSIIFIYIFSSHKFLTNKKFYAANGGISYEEKEVIF